MSSCPRWLSLSFIYALKSRGLCKSGCRFSNQPNLDTRRDLIFSNVTKPLLAWFHG